MISALSTKLPHPPKEVSWLILSVPPWSLFFFPQFFSMDYPPLIPPTKRPRAYDHENAQDPNCLPLLTSPAPLTPHSSLPSDRCTTPITSVARGFPTPMASPFWQGQFATSSQPTLENYLPESPRHSVTTPVFSPSPLRRSRSTSVLARKKKSVTPKPIVIADDELKFRVKFFKKRVQGKGKREMLGSDVDVTFEGNFETVREEILFHTFPHIKGTVFKKDDGSLSVRKVEKHDFQAYGDFVNIVEPKRSHSLPFVEEKKLRAILERAKKVCRKGENILPTLEVNVIEWGKSETKFVDEYTRDACEDEVEKDRAGSATFQYRQDLIKLLQSKFEIVGTHAAFSHLVDWVLKQAQESKKDPKQFVEKLVFQDIPQQYKVAFSATPLPTTVESSILTSQIEVLKQAIHELEYLRAFCDYSYERALDNLNHQLREVERRKTERTLPINTPSNVGEELLKRSEDMRDHEHETPHSVQ